MFRRDVQNIGDILNRFLRQEGLEMPLLQKRLLDSWSIVVGKGVDRYTVNKFIKNQVLFVKINNPALRSDLSMMKTQIVKRLNDEVGTMLVTDIRIY